jgi:hypothetical protein
MTRRPLGRVGGLALLASIAVAQGCSSTSALDVSYPDARANASLLAAAPPRRVDVAAVADRRNEPERIGSSATNGKTVVTTRPVPDIVRDALLLEIVKNGHAVGTGRPDAMIQAEVNDFSLDGVDGFSFTQYVGRVVIGVTVADARSGQRLLSRHYVGIKRRRVEKASEEAGRNVMDAALARALHDFATDPEMVAVLARVGS